MAKFNLMQRKPHGVVGVSPTNYHLQMESSASTTMKKVSGVSYPLARLTVRAQDRAKIPTCSTQNAPCVYQQQHVRMEGTCLAAGTEADRRQFGQLILLTVTEFQANAKAAAVLGFAPTEIVTQDNITSTAVNMTGYTGVPA